MTTLRAERTMTDIQARGIATALLRKVKAEEALNDCVTRSTGIVAAREARRELVDAHAALEAAVKEVQS